MSARYGLFVRVAMAIAQFPSCVTLTFAIIRRSYFLIICLTFVVSLFTFPKISQSSVIWTNH